ncbi:MAG: universal stress protein [Burkholderiales bacterium]|nr:universal stress protein [Burkholderiales bacterium]
MLTKILVPTDGSELSMKAVHGAIELARKLGSRLVGMTVTEPYPYEHMAGHTPIESHAQYDARMQQEAAARLAPVRAAAAAAGVAVDTAVKSAVSPYEAIIAAATEHGCDGIVMSSHGRRGLSALLLGSETQKVLTHSTIPVLVLR